MPGSSIQGKKQIKNWIEGKSDIKTIVDVGAGSCTYPKLLGERYEYIAIEIWAPYIDKFDYSRYYKDVIIGDIRYVNPPSGDLVIFGDVLEHLYKQDAIEMYNRVAKRYNHVVLSIPVSMYDGEVRFGQQHYGNKFEKHLSAWTDNELKRLDDWEFCLITTKRQIGVYAR